MIRVQSLPDYVNLYEFSLESIHDLGPDLLVAWDRDQVEITYPPLHEYAPILTVQVLPRQQITYLYSSGMLVAAYPHDLGRWFQRIWPDHSAESVDRAVTQARIDASRTRCEELMTVRPTPNLPGI